ncbi:MAG: flagellar basal body P-ring formation chaperone FlgA [Hyphomonadaceae bacterium]|nr:flagellar basal body P-ring formation chaperone FlgA [Hyphomonadaceae bacterium]
MIRFALAALACLALAPLAAAQAAGTTVTGEWIALGDVVPVTGDAASILIGPSPPPGQTLALDPVFIASVAKKSGVILAIPLDKPIWVTRATGNAPPAKVANPARQANAASQIASESEPAEILVLVRDIARGQRISDGDLEWVDAPANRTARNGATDMDAAIGMETKRALKAGQPILKTDLKQASLIKKGQPVKLVYAAPGMRLTVEGQAQNDAGKGEGVRILNSYSKRTVEAVATADGEAHVSRR